LAKPLGTRLNPLAQSASLEARIKPKDLTGVWKYISYLDRPFQTAANPIHALLSAEDTRGIGEAAYEGLTGESEIRASDILKVLGVPEMGSINVPLLGEVTGRGATGFVTEMFADPLNFLKVGKLLPKGAAASTDDIARLFGAGLPSGASLPSSYADQMAQGFRSALSARVPFTSTEVSLLPRTINRLLGSGADTVAEYAGKSSLLKAFKQPYSSDPLMFALQRLSKASAKNFDTELAKEASKLIPDIRDIQKQTKMTWAELGPTIMELAETGGKASAERLENFGLINNPELISKLQPLADKFVDFNRYAYKKLKEANVPIAQLDPKFGMNYMKHVLEPDQGVMDATGRAVREWGVSGQASRTSHWAFTDSKEVGRLFAKGGYKRGYLYHNNKYFKPDSLDQIKAVLSNGGEYRISNKSAIKVLGEEQAAELLARAGAIEGGSTIAEMRKMATDMGPEGQIVKLIDDPLTSMAGTILGSGRKAASVEMGEAIAKNADWALPGDKAPVGWGKMDASMGSGLEGMYVRPDIYTELTKTLNPERIDKDSAKFIRAMLDASGWWKAFTLAVPGYDTRNFITNFMHNIYGENKSLKNHWWGAKFLLAGLSEEGHSPAMLHKIFSKVGKVIPSSFFAESVVKGYSNKKIWNLAKKYGVIDDDLLGRMGTVQDISGTLGTGGVEAMRRKIQSSGGVDGTLNSRFNIASREGPLIRNMQVLHASVEGQGRMALFIDGLRKGKSPQEAAMNVSKWMLDYAPESLSAFERKYVQAIIPFYKFWRRNTANHIEMLLTEPGKIMTTARPFLLAQRDIPESEQEILPSWWKEGLPLKLSDDPETGASRYADLRTYVPFTGPHDLVSGGFSLSNIARKLTGGVTPLIKLPLELASGVSTFSGHPIERFPGEPTEFAGIPMTRQLQHVLRSLVRPVKEFDVLNPGNVLGEERLGRWQQSAQPERVASFLTGFKSMILDEQKRRRQVQREKKSRTSRLLGAKQTLLQQVRKANNPAHLFLYQRALQNINKRLLDVGADLENNP